MALQLESVQLIVTGLFISRDHTLNGGILFGLEGYVIEIQARAMEVLRSCPAVDAASAKR
jgi:hypothetical protein